MRWIRQKVTALICRVRGHRWGKFTDVEHAQRLEAFEACERCRTLRAGHTQEGRA